MTRNGTETRKGQDRETWLGAKHDGPVAAGDAPNTGPNTPNSHHATSPELNGWMAPKRIWLMDLGCGDVTWCEDQDPDGEQVETVEYVRADIAAQPQSPSTSPITHAMIEAGANSLRGSGLGLNATEREAVARLVLNAVKAKEQSND